MNFHETKYGQRFFDCQLPKLTNVLEVIAAALVQKPKPVQFQTDIPSNFLVDVYHGCLEPDAVQPDTAKAKPLDHTVELAYAHLKEQAPPKLWQQIEAYRLAVEERYDLYLGHSFETGYKTAMRLVVAGLTSAQDRTESGQ